MAGWRGGGVEIEDEIEDESKDEIEAEVEDEIEARGRRRAAWLT